VKRSKPLVYTPGRQLSPTWVLIKEVFPKTDNGNRRFKCQHDCGYTVVLDTKQIYDVFRRQYKYCEQCRPNSYVRKADNTETIGHIQGWNTWVVPDIGKLFLKSKL
jgi:hypothetical protein